MEEEGETGEGLGSKRKVRRFRFRKRKMGDDGDKSGNLSHLNIELPQQLIHLTSYMLMTCKSGIWIFLYTGSAFWDRIEISCSCPVNGIFMESRRRMSANSNLFERQEWWKKAARQRPEPNSEDNGQTPGHLNTNVNQLTVSLCLASGAEQ